MRKVKSLILIQALLILSTFSVRGFSSEQGNEDTNPPLFLPPLFSIDPGEYISSDPFDGLGIAREPDDIMLPLLAVTSQIDSLDLGLPTIEERFQELGFSSAQVFPFSIKVVDEEAKRFQITLGYPEATSITFTVSPEGIYNPEGTLVGDCWEVELNGEQFTIQMKEENMDLEVTIIPKEGRFPVNGHFVKQFSLGKFRGEVRLESDADNSFLSVKLENPEHFRASARIDSEEIVLRGFLNWGDDLTDEDNRVEVQSFRIGKDGIEIDGELKWTVRDMYTLTFDLGEEAYLRIASSHESSREFVGDLVTMLAGDEEVQAHFRRNNPRITEEEIRMVLEYMINKAGEDLGEILAEISSGQTNVSVPESLRFFLNLSQEPQTGEKIAEIILPLIAEIATLELNAYPEIKEATITFSVGDIIDEEGNNRFLLSIGIQDRNGDLLGVVAVGNPTGMSSFRVATSFARGLEALTLTAGGLEIELSREGIEIGSSESEEHTLAFAIFEELMGKELGTSPLEWNFRYVYNGEWELELTRTLPISTQGEATQKGKEESDCSKLFVILGNNGLEDFGIRVPFVAGGIIEVSPKEIAYELGGDGYHFEFRGGNGGWEFEFAVSIGERDEVEEDESLINENNNSTG